MSKHASPPPDRTPAGTQPPTADEDLLAGPAPARPPLIPDVASRDGRVAAADALRVSRMGEEIGAAFRSLAGVGAAVSVFGSARTIAGDPDYEMARELAARLGGDGVAIITGGGGGIMEAANRGAREAGAPSIGLTIDLPDAEEANAYLDHPVHFRYFFARKVMFVRYATAYVFFPGGLGTLDELFELLVLLQTHKIREHAVVLVNRPYWEPLLAWMRDMVLARGKISPRDLALATVADGVDDAYELLSRALR